MRGIHTLFRLNLRNHQQQRLTVKATKNGGWISGWLIDLTKTYATTGEPTFSLYHANQKTVSLRNKHGGYQPYFSSDGWDRQHLVKKGNDPCERFPGSKRREGLVIMKRYWNCSICFSALALLPLGSIQAEGQQESSPWQSLFNGRNLDGWSVQCPEADKDKSFWQVTGGVIEANSLGRADHDYVWLVSDREYADFVLRLKFRPFRNSTGNSGVQIRSRYDAQAEYLDGPQVDIHPPGPWRTGMVWDETRGNQRWLYPPIPPGTWVDQSMAPADLEFRYAGEQDEWNDLRITAKGHHLNAVLNGVTVMDYDGRGVLNDDTHRRHRVGEKGHIALQIHKADELKIQFKEIAIRTLEPPSPDQGPLPGQIIRHPLNPAFLARNEDRNQDGLPDLAWICGPGDPEGFLYLGDRQTDGTRKGPQEAIIRRLARYGGNSIYFQAVRSHGGDGNPDENPFIDSDPQKGLSKAILDQWEEWFSLMDEHRIVIYFFLYDDSARLWGTSRDPAMPPREKEFVQSIVRKFKHHPNLIWLVGEEANEAYHPERIRDIARLIAQTDNHGHLIGSHDHSRTDFPAFTLGSSLNHYSMQWNVNKLDEVYAGNLEAGRKAYGRYLVIHAENTAIRLGEVSPDHVRHAMWAAAMSGTSSMTIGMDIETTPETSLRQCRVLRNFFEHSDVYRMRPLPDQAAGETTYLLGDGNSRYILYSRQRRHGFVPPKLNQGQYQLTWLDCRSGETLETTLNHEEPAPGILRCPTSLGPEIALWIRPARD